MSGSRRRFLAEISRAAGLSALAAPFRGLGQGMRSARIPPAPRPKFSGRPFPVTLTDIARQAGLTQPTVYGDRYAKRYIFEANGPGIAFYDFDHDGWPDIFVPNGTRLEGFPSGTEPTNHLYRNNRDGTFTDITRRAGLMHSGWCYGVCVGDYDNDGADDLFLTYYGRNILYHNNADGTFTDVTKRAGLHQVGTRFSSGCTFVDYDRDGYLDLFVSHYVALSDLARIPVGGQSEYCRFEGVPVACGPLGLPPDSCTLYHNNGNGTFTDVSARAGIRRPEPRYGLTALAFDYDNDGWPDLFVACDSSPNLLFRNNHDGTFKEVGLESGVATNGEGREQANMGVAVGDCDGNGLLDLFVTHFSGDTPILYRNLNGHFYDDMTLAAGLAVVTAYVGWGAGFIDLDNDGWLDLLEVTGSIYPEVEKIDRGYKFATPRLVFRNLGGGSFEEVSWLCGQGIAAPHSSRGCAFADFNNDGSVDVIVQNMGESPSLLRNDCRTGYHWISIKLRGTHSNRSAIGGRISLWVEGRRQVREVVSGSSYISQNDFRQHFGLGSARRVDRIEVRWPNGKVEAVSATNTDQFIVIEEGRGIVQASSPRAGRGR